MGFCQWRPKQWRIQHQCLSLTHINNIIMKNKFLVLYIALIATTNFSTFAKDAPGSAEELRSEFESALKDKDTNALAALFNWEGVSSNMQQLMTTSLGFIAKQDIARVKLSPLPDGFKSGHEVRGVRYTPNVTVMGMIDIEYTKPGNAAHMPYGKKGNAFYVAGTTEEKLATSGKEKSLTFSVVSSGSLDVETYTGSYVYVKDGKETKQEMNGKGDFSKTFWGDYIKSCSVQKTSGKSLKVEISEDGKPLFQSGTITGSEPVVYERK
jgi:hypothetical protein